MRQSSRTTLKSEYSVLKPVDSFDALRNLEPTFSNVITFDLSLETDHSEPPFKPKIAWGPPPPTTSAKVFANKDGESSDKDVHSNEDAVLRFRSCEAEPHERNRNSDQDDESDEDKELGPTIKTKEVKIGVVNDDEDDISGSDSMIQGKERENSDSSYFKVKSADELLLLFGVKGPMLRSMTKNADGSEDDSFTKFYLIGEQEDGKPQYTVDKVNVAENLKTFIKLPAPIGFMLQCSIVRDKKGVDRGLFPTYFLSLEYEDGKRVFLMSARKRKKSKTSNYLISIDPCLLSKDKDQSMVGKVRSNLLGTQYSVYDGGRSPKLSSFLESPDDYREQLAAVSYEYNLLGFRGPRKLRVLIPSMLNESRRYAHRPEDDNDGLIERNKNDAIGGIVELKNKSPTWHEENQSYVLNFHGRVSKPSVKNFQLVHADYEDYTILQFGRTKEDEFTLDFRFPLCPIQAFAVALTSLDNKIACE